jgi:hypothetical protein
VVGHAKCIIDKSSGECGDGSDKTWNVADDELHNGMRGVEFVVLIRAEDDDNHRGNAGEIEE